MLLALVVQQQEDMDRQAAWTPPPGSSRWTNPSPPLLPSFLLPLFTPPSSGGTNLRLLNCSASSPRLPIMASCQGHQSHRPIRGCFVILRLAGFGSNLTSVSPRWLWVPGCNLSWESNRKLELAVSRRLKLKPRSLGASVALVRSVVLSYCLSTTMIVVVILTGSEVSSWYNQDFRSTPEKT